MRKLYILRENEEDGRLVDAMIAQGQTLDECDFENPVCPLCGCGLLAAFTEDEGFEIITWSTPTEKELASAKEWFLVCPSLECDYEEQVERVTDPMGATYLDASLSSMEFDEYSGVTSLNPTDLREVIQWLAEALEEGPNRKLESYLDYAEWHHDEVLERNAKWIVKVPPGKRVQFRDADDEEVTGTFLTATDEGFLLLREPDGSLQSFRSADIYWCLPHRPDREDLPKTWKELSEEEKTVPAKHRIISIHGSYDMVVVRGQHVRLSEVDRVGLYRVYTMDRTAGEALNLTEKHEGYWTGTFRRTDIESRYQVTPILKARGYWVDVYGSMGGGKWPAVKTHDPETAAALGLELQKPWSQSDDDEEGYHRAPSLPIWRGFVSEDEVEERAEVRLYHWPLPEFPLSDKR